MTIMVEDVQAAVRGMATELDGVNRHGLVAFSPQDGARPYIEARDGILHRVVAERGREVDRRSTGDLSKALYRIALDAAFSLALRRETKQRHRFPAGRDTRIGRLAKQAELLRRLDAQWAGQFRAGTPRSARESGRRTRTPTPHVKPHQPFPQGGKHKPGPGSSFRQ